MKISQYSVNVDNLGYQLLTIGEFFPIGLVEFIGDIDNFCTVRDKLKGLTLYEYGNDIDNIKDFTEECFKAFELHHAGGRRRATQEVDEYVKKIYELNSFIMNHERENLIEAVLDSWDTQHNKGINIK